MPPLRKPGDENGWPSSHTVLVDIADQVVAALH